MQTLELGDARAEHPADVAGLACVEAFRLSDL
jgi:hypothetical protein